MKTLVIYYSQTGGTRTVADAIAKGIRASGHECDLADVRSCGVGSFSEYDLIGLGCPVYYYQEPINIAEFIEGLPDQKRALWFTFCSHGTILAVALQSMARRLSLRNARVIGGHHTYSDGQLPYYPSPTLTFGHPDDRDLADAVAFGKAIVSRAADILTGSAFSDYQPEPLTREERWVLKELDLYQPSVMKSFLPKLSIDAELCIECGKCEGVCPVRGISATEKVKRVQSPCIYCYHCACSCPTGAIRGEYGTSMMVAPASTSRHKRSLDAAARAGKFRYYLSPDSTNYDDPLFVQQERKRGGKLQDYRLPIGLRLLRFAALHLRLRDPIFWMVRFGAKMSGNYRPRDDVKDFK